MLIAKIKIDNRGRIQLPSCFVKANGWKEDGHLLLKNHTHKDKIVLEYVKFDENAETLQDKHKGSGNGFHVSGNDIY